MKFVKRSLNLVPWLMSVASDLGTDQVMLFAVDPPN
jgi:hypothetical protein